MFYQLGGLFLNGKKHLCVSQRIKNLLFVEQVIFSSELICLHLWNWPGSELPNQVASLDKLRRFLRLLESMYKPTSVCRWNK